MIPLCLSVTAVVVDIKRIFNILILGPFRYVMINVNIRPCYVNCMVSPPSIYISVWLGIHMYADRYNRRGTRRKLAALTLNSHKYSNDYAHTRAAVRPQELVLKVAL